MYINYVYSTYDGNALERTLRTHDNCEMQTRLLLGVTFFGLGHFLLEDPLLLLEVLHKLVNGP